MDDLQQQVDQLTMSVVMLDTESDPSEWQKLSVTAEQLAEKMLLAEAYTTSDAMTRTSELMDLLARNRGTESGPILEHLQQLLQAVQVGLSSCDEENASLKEEVAKAGLYLRDVHDAEVASTETPQGIDEEFLNEIGNRVDQLESLLFSLSVPVTDTETVRSVFREYHTLKGEAGIVGLSALSEFCHQVESAIEDARYGNLVLTADVIDTLAELTQIARMILWNQEDEKRNPSAIKTALLRLSESVAVAPQETTLDLATNQAMYDNDDEDDFFAAIDESSQDEAISSEGSPESMDELPVGDEEFHTVSVDVKLLDQLLEHVGEVSLLGGGLSQREDMTALPGAAAQLQELARSCRSLQNMTGDLRMAPVRPLFQRMQRVAREAARSRHKRIKVHIEGADTRVDRSVLDHLVAAMVHLTRNAVDHGLESTEERRTAGKPEDGQIRIIARRSDADVVIEFSDDGRGLDLERLREKAVAMNVIAPGAELTDQEAADLIFSSGLSTADSVSDLSGRGVGMSIVRDSVRALRGHVDVETSPGKGTRFRLRLPVALAAIEGLIVRVGTTRLILPVASVRESFRVGPEQISTVEGRGTIVTIRGVVVPVLFLADVISLASDSDRVEDGVLVLIEEGDKVCGVLVDEVQETRQVVIRPLEGSLSEISAVTGAALMPDRSVALVVEVQGLIAKTSVASREAMSQAGSKQASSERTVETVSIGTNQVGMIDFTVRAGEGPGSFHDHAFAINAFKVREFVPTDNRMTQLPNAPRGFKGMLMLRDKTIPVVSLCELLALGDGACCRAEWSEITIVCEFAGRVVGFLAHQVNRVSYVSWNDILPPPKTGGQCNTDYVVGTILQESLRGEGGNVNDNKDDMVFVLDFERIVGQVMRLYGDMSLGDIQRRKDGNRVLLVEDSALIRAQMRTSLSDAGMNVIEASDGQAAREIIEDLYAQAQEKSISIFTYLDLILSDIEMPRMDGYTLTSWIKKHPQLRVLPVILHSSITNEMMVTRAREVEADGFVAKCDHAELVTQLRKYL